MNQTIINSALKRAVRTFIQVFVPGMFAGLVGVSDASALWVLALATSSAALAAAWRALWDPSSVPSLADPPAVDALAGSEGGSVHVPDYQAPTARRNNLRN